MAFQLEYDFVLPLGYFDHDMGQLYKNGMMRLATAADEIGAQSDPKVKNTPEFLSIALLARVVTQLGDLSSESINQSLIENLFVQDLYYLQDMYNRINSAETPVYYGECEHCGEKVKIPVNFQTAGR
jgi:hypothetical protein